MKEAAEIPDQISNELRLWLDEIQDKAFETWRQKIQEKYHLSNVVASNLSILYLFAASQEAEAYTEEEKEQARKMTTIILRKQQHEKEEVLHMENEYLSKYIDAFYEIVDLDAAIFEKLTAETLSFTILNI